MTIVDAMVAVSGGVLIGLAAGLLLLGAGRIAGVSGIVGGILRPSPGDTAWRVAFVSGLIAGGLGLRIVAPEVFAGPRPSSLPLLVTAGLLVGLGARIGGGCTSGHGVCGLARRSTRSFVATATFMAAGMLTVYVAGHVLGRGWW
jgi:uncharacterized membrane protein YedE/YeeE